MSNTEKDFESNTAEKPDTTSESKYSGIKEGLTVKEKIGLIEEIKMLKEDSDAQSQSLFEQGAMIGAMHKILIEKGIVSKEELIKANEESLENSFKIFMSYMHSEEQSEKK